MHSHAPAHAHPAPPGQQTATASARAQCRPRRRRGAAPRCPAHAPRSPGSPASQSGSALPTRAFPGTQGAPKLRTSQKAAKLVSTRRPGPLGISRPPHHKARSTSPPAGTLLRGQQPRLPSVAQPSVDWMPDTELNFSALGPQTAAKLMPWRQLTSTSCCHDDAAAGCTEPSQAARPWLPTRSSWSSQVLWGSRGWGLQVSGDQRARTLPPTEDHLVLGGAESPSLGTQHPEAHAQGPRPHSRAASNAELLQTRASSCATPAVGAPRTLPEEDPGLAIVQWGAVAWRGERLSNLGMICPESLSHQITPTPGF